MRVLWHVRSLAEVSGAQGHASQPKWLESPLLPELEGSHWGTTLPQGHTVYEHLLHFHICSLNPVWRELIEMWNTQFPSPNAPQLHQAAGLAGAQGRGHIQSNPDTKFWRNTPALYLKAFKWEVQLSSFLRFFPPFPVWKSSQSIDMNVGCHLIYFSNFFEVNFQHFPLFVAIICCWLHRWFFSLLFIFFPRSTL